MHLRSIVLRDWKAFESARFDFPAPDDDRNVILIGGENGFGKTSLFEAVILGLFGRDGMPLVNRATIASTDDLRAESFRTFMQRALHGHALAAGRQTCHIELRFEDDRGEPIEVQRTWHFTGDGKLRPDGEQTRLYVGLGRHAKGPRPDDPDPQGWYREWIAKTFLSPTLAAFFMFDGEAASAFANQEMSSQVTQGIEGLLGLPWLRLLASDLRAYATRRLSEVPGGLTSTVKDLKASIDSLEQKIKAAQDRLTQIGIDLAAAEHERETLTRQLSHYASGTKANLAELHLEKKEREDAYRAAEEQLGRIIQNDLPFALAGPRLRAATIERLRREAIRQDWLATVTHGTAKVDKVLAATREGLASVRPPLAEEQVAGVTTAVRSALDQLWYPAPEDAAPDVRLTFATGDAGVRIRDRLMSAEAVSRRSLATLLEAMRSAAAAARTLDLAIAQAHSTAPDLDAKKASLTDLNTRIAAWAQEKGHLEANLASWTPDLTEKRRQMARHAEQLGNAAKPERRAKRAEQLAEMLDDLIAEALPSQTQDVAKAMTVAIRAMAHRNDYLNTVRIDGDGRLKLFGANGDRNLRDFDLSAGEKQIFTQALISAIAQVSRKVFPLIVDTPLGRLDELHRVNVLRHLTQRDGQVILISTDTEVVGPYLEAIRPRVLKAYRIENRRSGDIGISHPREGYFKGQGFP